jgi:hypothetical protein
MRCVRFLRVPRLRRWRPRSGCRVSRCTPGSLAIWSRGRRAWRTGPGAPTLSQGLLDQCCGLLRRDVLPDAQDCPPGGSQQRVCLDVALPVALDLLRPVEGVRLGDCVVVWTPVPEATVQEDRQVRCWEDHVGGPSYGLDGSTVNEVAQSTTVDGSTKREFGARIASAIAPHARADACRRCPRCRSGHMLNGSGVPVSSTSRRNLE